MAASSRERRKRESLTPLHLVTSVTPVPLASVVATPDVVQSAFSEFEESFFQAGQDETFTVDDDDGAKY